MAETTGKHVCLLGGGIIGLCSAYYLLRAGHRVTILERGPEDHDSCALGSAGMICPSHFIPLAAPGMVALGLKWMWNSQSPFYVKPRLSPSLLGWGWKFWRASTKEKVAAAAPALRDYHLQSRKLFVELDAELNGGIGLVKRGLLMLFKTAHAATEEAQTAQKAREMGIPAQVLDSAEVARLDPAIQMDVLGGVYFPQDCHLHPGTLLRKITDAIRQLGGQFHFGAEVKSFVVEGDRIRRVETTAGTWEADEFVLCGGSWSSEMARGLRVSLPMQAGKGYSLTMANPPALAELCSILCEARVAVTPMGGTMRFGGTMEIAGLNLKVNPRRVQGIMNGALGYFPQFKAEHFRGIEPWRGLRPCSPDGLPYLGRFRHYQNFTAATGHAMLGLSLGPATGWAVAELLSGRETSLISPLYDPDRFI